MSSNTSRLILRKADYTDPESVIPDINNNWDKIDDAINANVFTSSTRPANPYEGRLIYETDTKLLAIFISGAWTYVGGDGYARGKRAVITSDVNSATTINNVEIGPYISITFTSEINRRYWIETVYSSGWTSGGTGNSVTVQPRVRWAAGNSVTTGGTQLGSDAIANTVTGVNTTQDFFQQFEVVPNINGNVTVGLFLTTPSTTKNVAFMQSTDRSAFLLARDVGST
jgi:hypothetical protein